MMPQKHLLHQLLQEDQEPFLLKNYISDRRCQINNKPTSLQLRKRKPISQNFCKNACFFSINNSPNFTKSPLSDFHYSPTKSPCKSSNAIFLHIPAKTASLLLEAAVRIQKQASTPKPRNNNNGFSLFGSLLKKLTHRNKTQKKRELKEKLPESIAEQEKSFSCSNNGRPSSVAWSETNEDKSWDFDLDTSCSGQSGEEDLESFESFNVDDFDNQFCESPFHFVLRRSPSPGHRTPVFYSPATSPCRRKSEEKEKSNNNEEEEEEEKEQCSPVSVLDPPFEDDDLDDDQSEDDGFDDLNSSYAIVQRAKQKLLQKLRRFEKLAELDPIELEKRMVEEGQESDNDIESTEGTENAVLESTTDYELQHIIERFVIEEHSKSRKDMKLLVSDLIKEEEEEKGESCFIDREIMVKGVCRKLESWKEVESNTIDMMVEQDFKNEFNMHQQHLKETATELEFGIFGLLVEELFQELVNAT